jgi:RNA polymerase sigma factor (sigma-70 family)
MNLQELPDRELVESCLQNASGDGWAEFMRRFQPLVAAVVSRGIRRWSVPNRTLVDDLVQSTLRKLCEGNCRAIRTFRWLHENSFRGFLKVVATNVVQDHFRKYPPTRVEEDLEDVGPEVARVETFANRVEHDTLVDRLIRCLEKLLTSEPDASKHVAMFLLYYRHGLTAKEISRLYQLTVKTVENTLLRLVRMAKARCI